MEFIINKEFESNSIQTVDFNFEELKKELSEKLENYKSLVVTEDSIKAGKADRAKLNSLIRALDDKKKEVKSYYLNAYEPFEKKILSLTEMIKEAVVNIDSQVKGFEETARNKKEKDILDFFEKEQGDLKGIIKYEMIKDDRWLNVTYSIDKVYKEITESFTRIREEMTLIKGMELEFEAQVLDKYIQTLSVTTAIAENTRLKEQRERLNAAKSIKKEEIPPIEATYRVIEETPIKEPKLTELAFKVWVSDKQLGDLKAFLKANNIKYGKV